MKRVVVGLSGGVDSSVAAHLLIQQGYDVIGMFMRNWHDESVTLSDDCPWIDDSNDALLIAEQLGIPFQVIDLSKEYKERIVNYMFDEYKVGRTPNPDVLCNREIKFDAFLRAALEIGADYVATGHYCRKLNNSDGTFSLLAGKDKNKDQSYFLCQISQNQLAKALFPIGELEKSEVRKIAQQQNFITADKKDSQGLCFVGKISLPLFLQQQLKPKEGIIIEIPAFLPELMRYHQISVKKENIVALSNPFCFSEKDGFEVAKHQGAHYFTIGQRKGVNVGGRPDPSYIIGIDTAKNIVYTGQKDAHPGLNRHALKLEKTSLSWLEEIAVPSKGLNCKVRIRYRQKFQDATLLIHEEEYYILFDKKQRGITPGQFAAWYLKEKLIGSAVIAH